MTVKDKDFMALMGIKEDEYNSSKERIVLLLEESDNPEEFIIQIFDISKEDKELTLIKEVGYGILHHLYDEDFIAAIRESGKYSFNAKNSKDNKNESFNAEDYGDNIINFKKIH